MVAARKSMMTLEEYLEFERNSEEKHEYLDGEVWLLHREPMAMAGAKPKHNLISVGLSTHLSILLRGRGCRVYNSDQKLRTPSGLSTYPDVTVVCGKPQYDDKHPEILLNPILIAEVLSPSSERSDRGSKFGHYRSVTSLQAYLLIAQDTYSVELYSRQGKDWVFSNAMGSGSILLIPALGISLSLADIYETAMLDEEET